MNFLRGRAGEDGLAMEDGLMLPIRVDAPGEVQVGIRPEHFVLGGDKGLAVRVDVVENLGGTRYLYGATRSGEEVIIEARDHPGIRADETVTVSMLPDRVLVFSPAGERLREQRL
jgi:lactose/L-arabinose transport system ATP-binding protein